MYICVATCFSHCQYILNFPIFFGYSATQFLSTTCRCGTNPLHISAPPTSLDGCGFFNSVVVRLPFNSISDGSEWWFYILIVTLIWLCKEAKRVYLCHHLDQKLMFFKMTSLQWFVPVDILLMELQYDFLFNLNYVIEIAECH